MILLFPHHSFLFALASISLDYFDMLQIFAAYTSKSPSKQNAGELLTLGNYGCNMLNC